MLISSRRIDITNSLGLHLRAADKFVRVAGQYKADVWVSCDGCKANGKSILDLTTLAAACGSRLVLDAAGADADSALDALLDLIDRGFDEQEPEQSLTAPTGGNLAQASARQTSPAIGEPPGAASGRGQTHGL